MPSSTLSGGISPSEDDDGASADDDGTEMYPSDNTVHHNAVNAAGALAVVHSLGLDVRAAADALSRDFEPSGHRLVLMESPAGVRVLDDCYNANPLSTQAALGTLAMLIDGFLQDAVNLPNPHLAHADSTRNGFSIVEASGAAFTVTQHSIFESEAAAPVAKAELADKFKTLTFRVPAGETALEQLQEDGTWKRWDRDAFDWV